MCHKILAIFYFCSTISAMFLPSAPFLMPMYVENREKDKLLNLALEVYYLNLAL